MKRPHIPSRQLLLVASALALTLPSREIVGQGPGLFDAFAARKESPSDPLFTGLSFTGYSGVFGIRLSGALNFNNGGNTSRTEGSGPYYRCDAFGCRSYRTDPHYAYDSGLGIGVGGWSADADLLIAPFRGLPVVKSLLLGFSPYAFVGVGGVGINPSNAADTSRAVWSFGAGVHHDLLGWLGVSAEARNRRSFQTDSAIMIGSRRSWEYRAGLSISFAGHQDPVPSRPPLGIIVASEHLKVDGFETAASAARIVARVLDRAEGLVSTPFRSGSTNPNIGFDAAGFVQYVFGEEGIELPSTSHAIAELGERVSTRASSLRPGDLLFFGNDGMSIDHVAIYAGHDRIIHATASGGGVRYDVLDDGPRGEWFADHLVTVRRMVAEGRPRPHVRQGDSRDQGARDAPDRAPRTDRARGE
jgi:cell wall-associated NlpC family hydrolase